MLSKTFMIFVINKKGYKTFYFFDIKNYGITKLKVILKRQQNSKKFIIYIKKSINYSFKRLILYFIMFFISSKVKLCEFGQNNLTA